MEISRDSRLQVLFLRIFHVSLLRNRPKNCDLPVVYISSAVICDSKRLDAGREHFKHAILALLKAGHIVAAFDKTVANPTRIFRDTHSFEYWYENFVRIQGWEVPEFSITEHKDKTDYFNCCTVE
jgi:hypothetical protein